ncbi:MAG: helix-turn-helix domain-containing protein [Candidatus Limnocylindria bacterium]
MPTRRRVIVVDNSAVARRIGGRIREARIRASLTQAQVSKDRYTAAYISALERGLAKPSMAALTFISERLGVPIRDLVAEDQPTAGRLEADILLASGRYTDALDLYDALLGEIVDRRGRAELLRGKAEALCRLNRGADAIGPASEAAETFASLGQEADAAWARYWLAYAQYEQDNPAEARGILQELLAQERAGLQVAPDFRFRLLTSLGLVEAWDGQYERALTYMEEARTLTADLSLRQRAAFLSGLALQYRKAGDLERSIRAGIEGLALYGAADSEREEAALVANMALTYLQLGNLERSAEHLRRARQIADQYGDPRLEAETAEAEAELALARGDLERAEDRIQAALEAAKRGGSAFAAVGAHVTRARMLRVAGEGRRARKSYEAAASLLRERGSKARLQAVLAEWAELLTESGDLRGANRLYAEALGRERTQAANP